MIEELRKYLLASIKDAQNRQEAHEKTRFHPPEPEDGEEEDSVFDPLAFRNKTLALETELLRFKELLAAGKDECPNCYILHDTKYSLIPATSPSGGVDVMRCRVCDMRFRIPA